MEKTITVSATEEIQEFELEGQFGMEVVGGLIGIALAALLFMYISVIGGKSYSVFEDDITSIGDININGTDVNQVFSFDGNINEAAIGSFSTINELNDLLPIFGFLFVFGALAVIISNLSNSMMTGGGTRTAL